METQSILSTDEFSLWASETVHILSKAGEHLRRMGGCCSTERLDRQGESILQRGLEFTEFVHSGFYNDNHNQATGAVVGVPEKAFYKSPQGWYTEGIILEGHPPADKIWSLAKSLSNTSRRLGFSIEGKILERRQGYKIAKAIVRNVAITNCPVNTDCTWGILAKSFCVNPTVVEDECPCCVDNASKALEVGHDVVPTEGGRVLVPQDLEGGDPKTTTYLWKCPETGCRRVFNKAGQLEGHLSDEHLGKSLAPTAEIRRPARILSESEAVKTVRQLTGWSENLSHRVVKYASEKHQQQV